MLESMQRKWRRHIRVNLYITPKVRYRRGILPNATKVLLIILILDDIHIPTLTVGQTLNFALSTKTPGPRGRLPGVSRSEFDASVKDMLLKMLNIVHTENTLVGDSFVRGVSGGERKRVSIAEMMTTRARVQCWDNSSRGLDASTALDFVRSLRVMTDVLGQTTFTTL
jgi:ATP-binding cassette subfamily G (WHITE) protein 2 (SNQ2)